MSDGYVALLAARMQSERLPRKAMADICGRPVLGHIVDRYRASERCQSIVICTGDGPEDHEIADFAASEGLFCHRSEASIRGDVVTLLDGALQEYAPDAEWIVRAMGDCPLVEPALIDWRFDMLVERDADVVWTGLPDEPQPIYGSKTSPWSRRAWDLIVERSETDYEREHAGEWLYRHPYSVRMIYSPPLNREYYYPYRVELDTWEDLEVLRKVYEANWRGPRRVFSLRRALKWLHLHQDVAAINVDIEEKTVTQPDWRRRGIDWTCPDCGCNQMTATVIRRRKLLTVCPRCGSERPFVEVPAFVAKKENRNEKAPRQ